MPLAHGAPNGLLPKDSLQSYWHFFKVANYCCTAVQQKTNPLTVKDVVTSTKLSIPFQPLRAFAR
jgi:hypothetical protein